MNFSQILLAADASRRWHWGASGFFAALAIFIGLSVDRLPPIEHRKKERLVKKIAPVPVDEVRAPPPPPPEPVPAAVSEIPPVSSAALAPQSISAFPAFGSGDGGFGALVADGGTGGAGAGQAAKLLMNKTSVERSARALVRTAPTFPPGAREKNIRGFVTIQVLVGANGLIERTRIVESEPAGTFDQAAIQAIQSWRFEPAVSKGAPVAAWVTQKIRFDLNE